MMPLNIAEAKNLFETILFPLERILYRRNFELRK